MVMLGAPPLRAAAHQPATRARFLDGAGPAAAGAILGAAVPLAERDRRAAGSGSSSPPRRCAARPARPADLRCSCAAALVGRRHYALAMGLAEELQDETAEVLSKLIRFNTVNPPGQRARVPGVARGLPRDAGLDGRARRRRAGAPEPGRDAARAATGRRSATSRTSTPCSPTPRTGAPTRGAARCRDGFLYGRGTIDMKNQTAAEAVAAAHLARAGARFNGTLKVISVADEETGGALGAKWITEERPGPLARRLPAQRGRAARSCPTATAACTASAWPRRARSASTSRTTGTAAHASVPGLADNALLKLAPVITQARRGPAGLRPDGGHRARCSRRSARTRPIPRRRSSACAPSSRGSRRCSTRR